MALNLNRYRKVLLILIVVLFFCGILFWKNTNRSLLTVSILNSLDDQYETHSSHNVIAPATIHPIIRDSHDSAIHPIIKDVQDSSIHPIIEDSQNFKYNHSIFALCYSYWEQQTNAVFNMWSLQKWASKTGKVKVVEPFADKSTLGLSDAVLYKQQFTNALHFSDYFDLGYWTNKTALLGIEPLVAWDTFLKYANRKVIVVVFAWGGLPGGVYVDDEINKHNECALQSKKFIHETSLLFKFLHFEIIKTICFAWKSDSEKNFFSIKEFNSYIISNDNATIWFGYWFGIGRFPLMGDKTLMRTYDGVEKILSMVRPSSRIIIDSRNYVKTILNCDFREYTAITIRTVRRYGEMVARKYTVSEVMDYFTSCATRLNDILDKSGSTTYFLSTDIGKFGDWTNFNEDSSAKLLQQFLQVIYGNKTIDTYHKEFIDAGNGIDDRGYIASMQKTIAESAQCLIVIGGFSTFQKSIVLNYQKNSQFNCVNYFCYEDPIENVTVTVTPVSFIFIFAVVMCSIIIAVIVVACIVLCICMHE